MSFTWGWALPALLVIPAAIALYVWRERKRRKFAVRYASLALIRDARPSNTRWRRHLPFALLLVAAASMLLAVARPNATVAVPRSDTSIILALDVSGSMCATDVDPNRLRVAQDAALDFVQNHRNGARIGIVAFAGSAELLVPPTDDTDALSEAIEGLTTGRGTAIGSAVLASIDALAEINPDVQPSTLAVGSGSGTGKAGRAGDYEPDIIVVLTDGANNRGVDPLLAAEQAADRRLRVYTIGFGTTDPGDLVCSPNQIGGFDATFGGGGFGNAFGGARAQVLNIDEPTLRSVADMTGGEYSRAEDADRLTEVFRDLPSRVKIQHERHEFSVLFVAFAALALAGAVALSVAWNRYP